MLGFLFKGAFMAFQIGKKYYKFEVIVGLKSLENQLELVLMKTNVLECKNSKYHKQFIIQ